MDIEAQKQWLRNSETIARFAGLHPTPDDFEEPSGLCTNCGERVPVSQLERNFKICDNCSTDERR